jgi:hypothetical protein
VLFESYFTAAILFLLSVSAFAEAEKYVEAHVFGDKGGFKSVKKLYKERVDKISRDSDEFYCFFNKSAFDVE